MGCKLIVEKWIKIQWIRIFKKVHRSTGKIKLKTEGILENMCGRVYISYLVGLPFIITNMFNHFSKTTSFFFEFSKLTTLIVLSLDDPNGKIWYSTATHACGTQVAPAKGEPYWQTHRSLGLWPFILSMCNT